MRAPRAAAVLLQSRWEQVKVAYSRTYVNQTSNLTIVYTEKIRWIPVVTGKLDVSPFAVEKLKIEEFLVLCATFRGRVVGSLCANFR